MNYDSLRISNHLGLFQTSSIHLFLKNVFSLFLLGHGIAKEAKIEERRTRNIERENTETKIERKINMMEEIKTKTEKEDG